MTSTTSDLSFLDVISLVFRNKIWVIVITFLGATAGVLIGFVQQPIYRADVLLSVVQKADVSSNLAGLARQVGGLAGVVNLGSTGGDKDVAIAVLRSRVFIVDFIRDRGIDKILFEHRLAADGESWSSDEGGAPTDNEVLDLFRRQIFAVREDNKTGLIVVSVEWQDPHVAAQWANELVREVNSQLRTRARIRAQRSVEYLESEATRVSNVETQKVIYDLIGQQINEIMLANVTEEYAFEVIDPATASDLDDYVKPRKVFLLASGLIAGFLLGLILIVGRELRNQIAVAVRVQD